MGRTVRRFSHRLRQDIVSPRSLRLLQLLFRRILRHCAVPWGAASLAARHSGLPRPNLRLPEGFRIFTPLTMGERRPVSSLAALPPRVRFRVLLADFASLRYRVPLRASRSIALPRHSVARHRHRCACRSDDGARLFGRAIHPLGFTPLPLSLLRVCPTPCRHGFD
jgi:hypothetical protein